jgi:predicted sulfurtransferase
MFILISFFSFSLQTCNKAETSATKTSAKNETTTVANTITAPKNEENNQQGEAPRITLAEAKADFDADRAIFIDTRNADAYNLEHVKGAINITTSDDAARYNEIPKGKKIIVYCS